MRYRCSAIPVLSRASRHAASSHSDLEIRIYLSNPASPPSARRPNLAGERKGEVEHAARYVDLRGLFLAYTVNEISC